MAFAQLANVAFPSLGYIFAGQLNYANTVAIGR
jgi:hypothetical protein